MPRNVRNFWVNASVDGRKEDVTFGPVAKDGGFDMMVLMRNEGEVSTAARIRGVVAEDGTLTLLVNGEPVHVTRR